MTDKNHMKAALLSAPGAAFAIVDIAKPAVRPNEVLVRIKASAVNPLDLKIRAGQAGHARHPLPAIPGIDLAGVVEAVGAQVERFRRGDEVFGMTGGVGGIQGSLAEFAAVDADLLAHKPVNLSMREAASVPLVFITAWEGLVDRAKIHAGQQILIQGGAGGVGHIAVQLAHALGARVFATGSAASKGTIESLGATAIDYQTTTTEQYVGDHTGGKGFDIVYDTVGGGTLDASFSAVRRFGHVVSALGWGAHALAPLSFRAGTYSGVFTLLPLLTGEGRAHHGDILREATQLAEAGKLKPRVDSRHFSLASAEDAYRALEDRTAAGKIVIDISE